MDEEKKPDKLQNEPLPDESINPLQNESPTTRYWLGALAVFVGLVLVALLLPALQTPGHGATRSMKLERERRDREIEQAAGELEHGSGAAGEQDVASRVAE